MRELLGSELSRVSGGGIGDPVYHDNRDQLKWGNNGFGNGADHQNLAPGNSAHKPAGRGPGGVGQSGGKADSRGDDQGPR